ncbi:LacI family DNA-binding transcriptional regulator [Kribbella sandramycini]|uniref:LacI family DNA-binding transcriptional regulator n=1 Tax=Kribbella sandramycini TaxID=60450 RepID=A0A7Y4NZ10_9ACTN|nr:LacI family DNA-binding transcriptional regulator [Kribbella sandramycini]MBB6569035.1 LacI family transcriptional regulator [Kribbella sandramycini]NOL41121.1 LacI family DNA-binding transcriptional regulator [Kribbella sandramycini]
MNGSGDGAARRPVTLDDVARAAGVSQPTASRVLNGSSRRVAPSYRERVLTAARELGYTPNLPAQAMARGTSRTIALVISLISDPYFSAMAAEIMKQAEAIGLHVSIAVTERLAERELDLVRELRGQQPRAIILAGTGYVEPPSEQALIDELQRYEETGGRVVLISRSDLPFETVDFDNHEGSRQLARELATLGYRNCLVLGSATPLLSMQQRVEGFVAGLAESGVTNTRVHQPGFSWVGAREYVLGLPDAEARELDLVFAVTDDMALGALAGLRERGLRVPEDVGVAGFDDISTLRDVVPRLTTVHVALNAVAQEAVYRATTTDTDLVRRTVPAYPVVRDSTPRVTTSRRR